MIIEGSYSWPVHDRRLRSLHKPLSTIALWPTVMAIEQCFVSERIEFVQQPVFTTLLITVVIQRPKSENCFQQTDNKEVLCLYLIRCASKIPCFCRLFRRNHRV